MLLLLLLLAAAHAAPHGPLQRPHFVFILADGLRAILPGPRSVRLIIILFRPSYLRRTTAALRLPGFIFKTNIVC